jgi:hypothetical protein
MAMGLAGPETTHECPGEGQQLFTRPTDRPTDRLIQSES